MTGLRLPPPGRPDFRAIAEVFPVVGVASGRIREHPVGFVEQAGIPFVAAQIGVHPEFLHLGTVAGLDDGDRRIRLDVENTVVIATVFHVLVKSLLACAGASSNYRAGGHINLTGIASSSRGSRCQDAKLLAF